MGDAKFVTLWKNEGGVWKVTRAISYERNHGLPAKERRASLPSDGGFAGRSAVVPFLLVSFLGKADVALRKAGVAERLLAGR